MECNIKATLIIESQDRLRKEFDDDVCNYFDCEGKNGSGMEYQEGYVVLDCCSGEIFFIIFK